MDEKPITIPLEPPVTAELSLLVKQAQAGDAAAGRRLRQLLDDHPEILQHVGDLAHVNEHAWIVALTANHPLAVEALKRTVAEMKADLAGEHPTRLQQMMVDQVIVSWLENHYWQTLAADAEKTTPLDLSNFRLRRQESAQKRFDNAVKTLTTVRQLLTGGQAGARHQAP